MLTSQDKRIQSLEKTSSNVEKEVIKISVMLDNIEESLFKIDNKLSKNEQ
jgi:hypothetical protein